MRFHLRRAATTSFRHVPASSRALRSSRSRPRKSTRDLRHKTRPNFVGATETFIDGPLSYVDLGGEMPGVNVPNLASDDDDEDDDVDDGAIGDSALVATSATSESTSGSTSVTFSSDMSVPTSTGSSTTTSSEDGLDNGEFGAFTSAFTITFGVVLYKRFGLIKRSN